MITRIVCIMLLGIFTVANANDLENIDVRSLSGNQAQIKLTFSKMPLEPKSFSMDSPEKIIFDFPEVKNKISKAKSIQQLSVGVVKGVEIVESDDKTRLIVDVVNMVPFKGEKDGNHFVITLSTDVKLTTAPVEKFGYTIGSLDFRRGEKGEGRLILELNADNTPIDFSEGHNGEMVVYFKGATVPPRLKRRFDVRDFGTPMEMIVIEQKGTDVIATIAGKGDFEKLAFQVENQFIVEARPLTELEKAQLDAQKFKFTGEHISLNFQDIEVRAILQLMADFTGLNVVVSDSVSGNVTLRLDDVPWDQALDFILRSKGLGKREKDNIVLIAPNEEIAAREQAEMTAQQQSVTLAPLKSEFVQINYAKANDMVKMLKDDANSILSIRGQISVDERTNTLLIKDTEDKLIEIKKIITRLDIPVRQVMVETQIVQIRDTFNHALGVEFGGAAKAKIGGRKTLGISGQRANAVNIADSSPFGVTRANSQLFFDAGGATVAGGGRAGQIGLALARLPGGTLLDLELQAGELEEKTKIIARPKLMTLDKQKATIETGKEVPYQTTANGGTTTTFKKATIKLEVTPSITPDERISLELSVSQDELGAQVVGLSELPIDTTNMTTTVLVNNGETVVLGGIFKVDDKRTGTGIPYLRKLPLLGRLFGSSTRENARSEILIFVTPKVVKTFLQKQ